MKPTVGRIVHFYTGSLSEQSNNRGTGPYAAIIVGLCSTGDDPNQMVNLNVFGDHAPGFCVGSVKGMNVDSETPNADQLTHYWQWPPREEAAKPDAFDKWTDGLGDKPAETFLDRLKAERTELEGRLDKLQALLQGPKPDKITDEQWELLHKQDAAMTDYLNILVRRCDSTG